MALNSKIKVFIFYIAVLLSTAGNTYAQEIDTEVITLPKEEKISAVNTTTIDTKATEAKIDTTKPENLNNNEEDKNKKEEVNSNNTTTESKKTLSGRAVIVDLASDKLEYLQDEDTFVATGSARVLVTEQNAELKADKIVYHQGEQYLTAEGNVRIIKNGKTILGNYAKIDLNKQSALISDPNTIVYKVKMNAKEANLYPGYIELKEGTAVLNQDKMDIKVSAGGLYKPEELNKNIPGQESVTPENQEGKKPAYKIVAREIEVDRSKKRNNLIVRGAKVYIGKFKIAAIPKLTLTIGENANSIETMLPEVGFDKNLGGIYFGPSLTLNLPKNSTLKLSPVFAAGGNENAVGGGAIARFRSSINKTDIAYTTTSNHLVMKGEQKIYKDTTKIKYYVNDYPDDDFMGTGFYRPNYLVELVDERKIGKVLNHNIFTRASGGYARDVNDGVSSSRVQLQGNIISDKPILAFKDYVALRLQSQFNVAAYGTGDGYAVIRGGPRVDWKLWRLGLTTSYMQAGVWGQTPFIFDEFIRGTSNLILAGDFKVSKFLSVGNIRSLNLSKDGSDPRLSTENQFYARIGPEDFKFRIGYDIERKRSIFGLDLFLGSGRSAMSFDRMKILHPEMDIR